MTELAPGQTRTRVVAGLADDAELTASVAAHLPALCAGHIEI